ncbi:predicted protein, partial [Nematostella vectensis]
VFTTVVDGIGSYFSPSKSPSITPQYLADIIQRVVHCINMSAYGFYYEKLFVAANKCLASMCNWLQMHYACCSDLTASFVIQQLTNCPNVSYSHILSILLLLDKIINKVGTSMTETFIKQILDPNSAIMKLRLCADEALWKLSPTLFELLTEQLSACEWQVAACFPAIQYTILHALYTHSQSTPSYMPCIITPKGNFTCNTVHHPTCPVYSHSKISHKLSHHSKTQALNKCVSGIIYVSLWKLSPTLFELLTEQLSACEWQVAACFPAIQYTILHALYTHSQRCLQDSVVRLMDVCEEVRETYLSLIKIIPTDILTSFASRNLLQDRVLVQKANGFGEFKKLTTSCEDIWWTRKSHVIKPPSGTFHSYNFQVIMAFIQLGVLP